MKVLKAKHQGREGDGGMLRGGETRAGDEVSESEPSRKERERWQVWEEEEF